MYVFVYNEIRVHKIIDRAPDELFSTDSHPKKFLSQQYPKNCIFFYQVFAVVINEFLLQGMRIPFVTRKVEKGETRRERRGGKRRGGESGTRRKEDRKGEAREEG